MKLLFLSLFLLFAFGCAEETEVEEDDPIVYKTYLYVSSDTDQRISSYEVNETTGALTAIEEFDFSVNGFNPWAISSTLNGSHLFVSDAQSGEGGAHVLSIASTGVLTHQNFTATTNDNPVYGLTYDPNNNLVFASNYGTGHLVTSFSVDATTKALTLVESDAGGGLGPIQLVTHPTKMFLYATMASTNQVSVYTYDATGAITFVENQVPGNGPTRLAVHPDGAYLVVLAEGAGSNVVSYAINQTTGALTEADSIVPASGSSSGPRGVVFHPTLDVLYVASKTAGKVTMFEFSTTDGTMTEVGTALDTGTEPYSIAIDSQGKYVVVANSGSSDISIYSVDQTTGALTELTGSPFGADIGIGTNPRFTHFVRVAQ